MNAPLTARIRPRHITSPTNSLLKVFRRALAQGKTQDGWVAIEGARLVDEAIRCGGQQAQSSPGHSGAIRSVLVSVGAANKFQGLLRRLPYETEIAHIPDELFRKLSQTETPQGIAALVELPAWRLDDCLKRDEAIFVLACGVQDPGNFGTILRTSAAFRATAVVAIKGTVSFYNPKVVRSSGGALFQLPVFPDVDLANMMGRLREAAIRTVVAEPAAGVPLQECDLRGRLAILIGSEAAGVSPEISSLASARVRIPMKSGVDSVNAAVAAGILLYETQRQRGFRFDPS